MTEHHITDEFVTKFDAFAASLEPAEQVMLVGLLTPTGTANVDDTAAGDASEVEGFSRPPMPYGGPYGHWGGPGWKWPGLNSLGVTNIAGTTDGPIAPETNRFGSA